MIDEILLVLAEECGETVQVASKCMRFGLNGTLPGTDVTNASRLEAELGDILAMVELLTAAGAVSTEGIAASKCNKLNKLKLWSSIDHSLIDKCNA